MYARHLNQLGRRSLNLSFFGRAITTLHCVFPSNHLLIGYIDLCGIFLAEELNGFYVIICIALSIVAMLAVEMIAVRKVLGLSIRNVQFWN